MKGMMSDKSEKWRIEDDLCTLQRAAEIKKDPKRMAAVSKLAQEKLLTLAGVVGDKDAV